MPRAVVVDDQLGVVAVGLRPQHDDGPGRCVTDRVLDEVRDRPGEPGMVAVEGERRSVHLQLHAMLGRLGRDPLGDVVEQVAHLGRAPDEVQRAGLGSATASAGRRSARAGGRPRG